MMKVPPTKPAVRHLRHVTGKKDLKDTLEEVLDLLRRFLRRCLCVCSCGCIPFEARAVPTEVYEAELTQEERSAVESLLCFMETAGPKKLFLTEDRLRDLCVLTYSDNIDLQRSAAQCFAELSQTANAIITEVEMEPLVVLLHSKDALVRRSSSLAVSNYAIHGPECNRVSILNSNVVKPLIGLLESDDVEVQCNTCGCITTLSTTERSKEEMVALGIIPPLLLLAQSPDIRVQRNSTGALLNLSHLQPNRNELVEAGAIPIINNILTSPDCDIQYYCAAVLSNFAFTQRHRYLIIGIGEFDIIRRLIDLLESANERVKVQSLASLRNLTSDTDAQHIIVKLGALSSLKSIINTAKDELLLAGLALLRNLTIHKKNEECIVDATFLSDLIRIVRTEMNSLYQEHAAGSLRNLAAGDQVHKMLKSDCVEVLTDIVLRPKIKENILLEVTHALAILADEEDAQLRILNYGNGHAFERLMAMSLKAKCEDLQYSCAGLLAQLLLSDQSDVLAVQYTSSLIRCIENYLSNDNQRFAHLACWMLVQLLPHDAFFNKFSDRPALIEHIQKLQVSGDKEAVRHLATSVLEHNFQ